MASLFSRDLALSRYVDIVEVAGSTPVPPTLKRRLRHDLVSLAKRDAVTNSPVTTTLLGKVFVSWREDDNCPAIYSTKQQAKRSF